MSAPALLPRPQARRPLLALAAYAGIVVAPFVISLGLLAGASGQAIPLAGVALALLALRQANVFVISALYHRSFSHRALRFHPAVERILRVWGWLFVGPGGRTWALVHRQHHAAADTPADPHSPVKPGESLWTVGRQASRAFLAAARDPSALARFGRDLPDDRLERLIQWDERRLFGALGLRMPFTIGLFGALFWAAGLPPGVALLAALAALPGANGATLTSSVVLIGGVGHLFGYRNYALADASTNILPIDLLGWGEGLHQNHHAHPGSADLAVQRWEWDPGYAALRAMARIGWVIELRTHRGS